MNGQRIELLELSGRNSPKIKSFSKRVESYERFVLFSEIRGQKTGGMSEVLK